MKHISIVFIVLWMSITITPAQEEHWMPDTNLRAAIKEAIGLSDDVSLMPKHLELLSNKLRVRDSEISSLTGLEHATNLKVLSACGNQISDLSPLSTLIQIEGLSLCGNPLSDISPISGLINLRSLDLGLNPTADVSPLRNLTKLEILNIGGGEITDITALANLTQLHFLKADNNRISDIRPLAGLKNLKELYLNYNRISNFSPLTGLSNLEKLHVRGNPVGDLTALFTLNLIEFEYDEVCTIAPLQPPVEERIITRTFPSIFQAWGELVLEGLSHDERVAYHDLHFSSFFTLKWHLTADTPTRGLSTHLAGDLDKAKSVRQRRLILNPNMLFLVSLTFFGAKEGEFPENSDYLLRDAEGQVIEAQKINSIYQPYHIDFVKPDGQELMIERIVGIAECGLFDGVMIDGFGNNATGFVGRSLHPQTDEEIIEATTRILREVRSRVHDDFLIVVNANREKPTAYNEYINGSFMELDRYHSELYTYRELIEIEETLLWNEENLRSPQINCLEGEGAGIEPPDSPKNVREMRLITTLGLTHSDGYVIYKSGQGPFGGPDHIWYDFWDVDIGKPIGEKGKHYGEGLFIREFTNGWAVYNRSGKAQTVQFPMSTTGVSSGIAEIQHTVPNLDGEIYLKQDAGTLTNGVVEVIDIPIMDPPELASKWMPDANLRTAVIEAIGVPDDVRLRKEDLKGLYQLHAWDSEISDLTGLEHATNLKNLSVCRNQISDLSPLASLFHLERLTLCVNQISDISPLSNLVNLTHLDLRANGIEDIIPIEGLKNLEVLNIDNNSVTDITPVANLKTNLKVLSACGNQISDLSPLSELIHLEHLTLCGNPLSDISPLSGLINLKSLDLGLNPTADVSPLRNLTKLEILNIGGGDVKDITVLANLTHLHFLRANNNRIDDIRSLAGLKNLKVLELSNNLIRDFSPLAGLNNLEKLDIRGNPVDDLTPLFDLDIVEFQYDEEQLETEPSPDVNGDGEVNILDLVAVANAFGEADPDLNGDGVVNIQDLVIVANAF